MHTILTAQSRSLPPHSTQLGRQASLLADVRAAANQKAQGVKCSVTTTLCDRHYQRVVSRDQGFPLASKD
jgi:hypothetical protein